MSVCIENGFCRYVINDDGTNGYFGAPDGPNRAVTDIPCAFVKTLDGECPATAAGIHDGLLTLGFAGAGVQVRIRIGSRETHTVFDVEEVQGSGVQELVFPHVPLTDVDDGFSPCLLGLNLKSNVLEFPGTVGFQGAVPSLKATSYAKFGIPGARIALAAAPYAELRNVLKRVADDADGIPVSNIGGPWALDVPINRGSYLFDFGDITEETVDDWIKLVRSIGFNQIDFHGGKSFRFGDCRPDPELYPDGPASLKAVIDKLHEAGISAGLHTYAFFIDKHCPWVAPVPDDRLAKDAVFTLAEPVDADTDIITVNESTADMSAVTGFFVRNSNTLHVGDELITYTGVNTEPPYGFTGCTRGALETKASSHEAGAKAGHLKECFGLFVPDPQTTLFDEVAQKAADLYNACGFDMTYMDALDGEDVLGGREWGWHYGSKYVFEFFNRIDRPALFEASTFHHHLWWVRSRLGAWDYPFRGDKRFIDVHVKGNESAHRMFFPPNLGWWSVKTWDGTAREPSYRDNIEYLCCKALGADTGLSLMGIKPETMGRPVFERLGGIIRQYETLRHEGYFSDEVKEQLRRPGDEFTLVQEPDGRWAFRPVMCYRRHAAQPGDAWTVENPHADQPVRLRIEALQSTMPPDDPDTMTIVSFEDASSLTIQDAAEGVSLKPATVEPAEDMAWKAIKFEATRSADEDSGTWAKVGQVSSPPLNLEKRRGFGVWIHGDGGGEVIAVQIAAPSNVAEGSAAFLVDIDFTGWKYIELVEPDSERLDEYSWPGSSNYSIYRSTVRYEGVETISLWYNGLKPGQTASCRIGPVVALPVREDGFSTPALSINGSELSFPVTMPAGSYLEVDSDSAVILYDRNGEVIEEVSLDEERPVMVSGENRIEFCARADGSTHLRANIVIMTHGKPIC